MMMKRLTLMQRINKRSFDIFCAFIGLILSLSIILIAFVVASFDTKSNGFFTQLRVGKEGKLFRVIKIKTMRKVEGMDTTVTKTSDARITKIGAFFRKTKIDELPQLFNVLIGKMSFVGPRPDVPGFADNLVGDERAILSLRPGITGPATLVFRKEEDILENQDNPEKYNREVIFPQKVKINLQYIEKYSFWKDIKYIVITIFPAIFTDEHYEILND